jgi:NADH dehydrogenase
MKPRTVVVIGGSGFVGRHVIAQLVAQGVRVRAPTRRAERARHLLLLPTVEVIEADVMAEEVLVRLLRGCDAVVNLVGVLHSPAARTGGPTYGAAFAAAHVTLPERIRAACHQAGVQRVLHMSALGASSDAPSEYLRSKAAGEAVFSNDSTLHTTYFRPSVIFGPEDRFLNLFAALARTVPMMALAGAEAKFQPIFVGDVARVMVQSLFEREAIGATYSLVGPHVYTLRELVRYAMHTAGYARPIIGLSPCLGYVQAWLLEYAPGGPLMSRDNVRSMQRDNVSSDTLPFGLHASTLASIAPSYLSMHRPGARYDQLRKGARR